MYIELGNNFHFNRFQHHVMDYKGATVMMLEFSGFSFCLAVDEEWK